MKPNLLLLSLILFSGLQSFGQKVKIKKNQIFIDDVHRGFVYKDQWMKSKLFFLDINKDTLFVVGQDLFSSPIDSTTKKYCVDFLYIPKMKAKVYKPFNQDKYYFTDNSIVEYYLRKNVVNPDFTINYEKMGDLLNSLEPAPPAKLVNILANEEASIATEDYIIPRIVKATEKENALIQTEMVLVRSEQRGYPYDISPTGRYGYTEYVYQQKYTDLQNFKDEILVIAKVITKTNDLFFSKDPISEISVYNSRNKLVGHLGAGTFGLLSIYRGNIHLNYIQHNMNNEANQYLRAKKLVEYLIKNKRL